MLVAGHGVLNATAPSMLYLWARASYHLHLHLSSSFYPPLSTWRSLLTAPVPVDALLLFECLAVEALDCAELNLPPGRHER